MADVAHRVPEGQGGVDAEELREGREGGLLERERKASKTEFFRIKDWGTLSGQGIRWGYTLKSQ